MHIEEWWGVVDMKYQLNNQHIFDESYVLVQDFLVTLIASSFLWLLPEIILLAMLKAQHANLVCLWFEDKACCTLTRHPVLMAHLWRLMECLSAILGSSVFHLNCSTPLFILSFIHPLIHFQGKTLAHPHGLEQKKQERMGTEQQT